MDDYRGRAIIVGGGPVGTLTSIFLARRGYKVDLYEAESDIRCCKNESAGRQITLVLNLRGLTALQCAGINQQIEAMCVPM
ncbi:kynurenine 3-monooxygenase-like [Styela clava]